jgi:N-acetylneuraminate lyase
MQIRPLEGLIAAPPSPMGRDGQIDLEGVDPLCALLKANGLRGAFVCGTTGESTSLTVDERLRLVERWAAAGEEFAVIAHVGHNSLPVCRRLATHARDVGADAVGLMAPSFFRPQGVEQLVAFCAEVAAAAPELPFYYYHIPEMTGVAIPAADVLEAGAERIPNLAGAKFTSEDLMDFGRCLTLRGGRFDMLYGRDEMLLSALVLGTRGAVGTTYTFAAPLYHRIMGAHEAGQMAKAREDQARARRMVHALHRHGGLAAVKPIMRMIGVDCGEPRLPLRSLDEAECRALRADLEEVGFFEYCCRP